MSSFGALIAKLQNVKHVVFIWDTRYTDWEMQKKITFVHPVLRGYYY